MIGAEIEKRYIEEVSNCDTCPFAFAVHANRWRCTHPSFDVDGRKLKRSSEEIAALPAPGWCPLREHTVVVQMRLDAPEAIECERCKRRDQDPRPYDWDSRQRWLCGECHAPAYEEWKASEEERCP